ncbi:MAG: GDP-L-fucose synthase family protein, partial [Legionellaceae bacterium]
NMKIFLTGGRGMVGRNVRLLAARAGFTVDAPTQQELNLDHLHHVVDYLKASAPDVVIHAAGRVGGIQANMAAPYDFCFENLQMGLHIIEASKRANISRLINLGSSCMYPRAAKNPLKEEDLLSGGLEPTNEGYAIAKLAVAKLTSYANQQHGFNYKTLIPCNLYGYGDKFSPEHSHMIPAVIRKLHEAKLHGQTKVDIWGDGTARREFLFAQDLADFILLALTRFDELPQLMNVGLGHDYSIREYYDAVKEVVGYEGTFTYDLSKPKGMHQKLVDVSIQTALGWQPKTDLITGIQQTYDFFLDKDKERCYL